MRYVLGEIFGNFGNDENDPIMTLKDSENDKKSKQAAIFNTFMQFLSVFLHALWIGMLKRVNRQKICSPVVFYEEINAVF